MCGPAAIMGVGAAASALGSLLHNSAVRSAQRRSEQAMLAEAARQKAMREEGQATFQRSLAAFANPGDPSASPARDAAVAATLARAGGPGVSIAPMAPANAGGAAMNAISSGVREGIGRAAALAASGRALNAFSDAQFGRNMLMNRNALDLALLNDRSRRSAAIGQMEAAAAGRPRPSLLGDLLGVGGNLAVLYGAMQHPDPVERPKVGPGGRIIGGI